MNETSSPEGATEIARSVVCRPFRPARLFFHDQRLRASRLPLASMKPGHVK
jgi:hypothetical protein